MSNNYNKLYNGYLKAQEIMNPADKIMLSLDIILNNAKLAKQAVEEQRFEAKHGLFNSSIKEINLIRTNINYSKNLNEAKQINEYLDAFIALIIICKGDNNINKYEDLIKKLEDFKKAWSIAVTKKNKQIKYKVKYVDEDKTIGHFNLKI